MNQPPMQPTTPEQLAESTRAAIDIFDNISNELGGAEPGMTEIARDTADHLRTLFPDLSDETLAGFMAFIFTNIAMSYRMNPFSSTDLLAMALTFGHVLKQFAWSVTTPTGESPNEAA